MALRPLPDWPRPLPERPRANVPEPSTESLRAKPGTPEPHTGLPSDSKGHTQLTTIGLCGCNNITDASVIALSKGCTQLTTLDLGSCDKIEEILIGEDKVIKFSGCHKNEACTIVLRGSGQHILDEAERSLHDAICVLVAASKNHRCILGGGNSEMRMSLAVDELALSMSGK